MSMTGTPHARAETAGTAVRLLAAQLCDGDQGVHPAPARPRVVRDDRDDPGDAASAVRLRHQHHAASSADRGAACRRTAISRRSILKALENTAYFRFTREVHNVAEFDDLLLSGKVLFGVEIPRGFERAVRRGDRPALLVAADATDPVAAGAASARSARWCRPRCSTTCSPAIRRPCRSRSGPMPATTRRPRRG